VCLCVIKMSLHVHHFVSLFDEVNSLRLTGAYGLLPFCSILLLRSLNTWRFLKAVYRLIKMCIAVVIFNHLETDYYWMIIGAKIVITPDAGRLDYLSIIYAFIFHRC